MNAHERLSYNFAKKALACLLMVLGSAVFGAGMLTALPGNLLAVGGKKLCFWVAEWRYQSVEWTR